jgi:hypothetical protein
LSNALLLAEIKTPDALASFGRKPGSWATTGPSEFELGVLLLEADPNTATIIAVSFMGLAPMGLRPDGIVVPINVDASLGRIV